MSASIDHPLVAVPQSQAAALWEARVAGLRLSPGTPLDLLGSPAQPAKKIRRPGAATTGVWEMKISQPLEEAKQDSCAALGIPA